MKILYLGVLLCFSGCSYKKYQVKKLKPLTDDTATYIETKKEITIRAKKWNTQESKEFFYDVDLTRKNHKVQPVQITLENKRDSDITCAVIMPDGTRLSKALVARQLHMGCGPVIAITSATGIAAWFLLAGSCASLVIGGTCSSLATGAFAAAGVLGIAGTVCLLGVPVYMTYYRTKVNELIDEQLALNSLYKHNYLGANEILNGLIYSNSAKPKITLICSDNAHGISSFELIV